jgi:hypothetical protein
MHEFWAVSAMREEGIARLTAGLAGSSKEQTPTFPSNRGLEQEEELARQKLPASSVWGARPDAKELCRRYSRWMDSEELP